jgi:Bacteriophage minor capsid protein
VSDLATPAAVLAEALYDNFQIEFEDTWPFYVGTQPDTPEECITFFDSTPIVNKKSVDTGFTLIRPGVQLRARGIEYMATWRKLEQIRLWCDDVAGMTVTLAGEDFVIVNVSQQSGIINIGRTEDRLYEFTLNVVMTLTT